MDIFNTLALITKPENVELPAEATLEAIETLTELDYCPNCGAQECICEGGEHD